MLEANKRHEIDTVILNLLTSEYFRKNFKLTEHLRIYWENHQKHANKQARAAYLKVELELEWQVFMSGAGWTVSLG